MNDERSHSTSQEPKDEPENFWRLVAEATTLGWNLMVPIVGGVLLGRYLDDKFGNEFTWTLSLLLMGVAVAFNNLYAMYVEHGGAEPPRKRTKNRRPEENKESETHEENQ